MTPSFFWGALLVGRMSAPLLLRRMRETTVASAGLTVATLGIAALLAAQSMTLVVLGASLAGLGLASVYPISVSMLSPWFGRTATRVSGPIFAGGNLGGAALPWLVGALSTHYGSLRVGFLVPLLGALIMLAVYVASGRPGKSALQPV
jgi:FHS family glucose/mannose:H+ symporter-like MFS transporter